MPIATVFDPQGIQMTGPDGVPLVYERLDDHRAFLSAQKAWWPVGKVAKRGIGPEWGKPPEGAEIRMEGQPWKRFELVAVRDAAGEIVDAQLQWVDIQARAAAESRAARVAALKERLNFRKEPEPDHSAMTVLRPGEAVTGGGGGGTTGPVTFTDPEGRTTTTQPGSTGGGASRNRR